MNLLITTPIYLNLILECVLNAVITTVMMKKLKRIQLENHIKHLNNK